MIEQTSSPDRVLDLQHEVQYYERSEFLVARVADFIGPGLQAGEAVVLLATPKHADLVEAELLRRGIGLAAARAAGSFVELDAVETLAKISVDGRPDPDLFDAVVGVSVERARAAARTPVVRVFGEMVTVVCAHGRSDAALALEAIWNRYRDRHPTALLHGYAVEPLDRREIEALSALHTRIAAREGAVRIA